MISMSRVWLGQITDEEVAVLRISDGAHLSGPKPSTEWRIHQGILQQRNDVSVVLHWHSAYATIMACRNTMNVNYNVIPEIPYYIGPIGSVAYQLPGSEELADQIAIRMKDHDLVLMQNHGEVTVGKSYEEAIQRAVFFELACRIIVVGGDNIAPLSDDQAETLTML